MDSMIIVIPRDCQAMLLPYPANVGAASCQSLVTGMQIFCNKYLLQTVRNTMYYRQPFLMLGFVGRVDVLPR